MKKCVSRMVGAVLASAMVLSLCAAGALTALAETSIPDGYVSSEADVIKELSLFNFNNEGSFISLGIPSSANHTRNGNRYSIHWNEHQKNNDLYINLDMDQRDWSDYDSLDIWMYSEKATNSDFMILAMSPDAPDGARYFWKKLQFSWTGWRHINFSLEELDTNRGPSFDSITTVRFCSGGGWNLVANSESDVYISSISLKKVNKLNFLETFYTPDAVEETLASLEDAAAIYGSGSKVTTDSGASEVPYTFGWKNSEVTVPVDFFKDYFGADVTYDDKSFAIKRGNVTVSGDVGSSVIAVDGIQSEISVPVYSENGHVFVPGAYSASALGLETVSDNKLLVIGKNNNVKDFARTEGRGVNEKNEIASYMSYHEDLDVSQFSDEDCTAVKQNWISSVVGNEASNDITDDDIKAKIAAITSSGSTYWAMLEKNASDTELFPDMTSTASADITTAYTRVCKMAMAYSCYGGELYGNESLLDDILYSLDWLAANRYNSDIKSKTSGAAWVVTGFDNWWDWKIGVPKQLIPTLMMIENHLTRKKIENYLALFDKLVPAPSMTGANFTDLALLVTGSALLKNNAEKVAEVQTAITKMFLYADDNVRFAESLLDGERSAYTPIKGAGFFTDGSYILHTLHPHLGTYGIVQMSSFKDFISLYAGTKFQRKVPFTDNIYHIFENSFEPVIYDGKIFRWTLGRNPERNTAETSVHSYMFCMAESFDDEIKKEIYSAVKAIGQIYYDKMVSGLPISHIKKFKDLMADETIAARAPKPLNKMYNNSDKMVHQREKWGAAVSMSSSRLFNYESINEANLDGWYLSDGRTEYYLKGSDINSSDKYYAGLNKYRLPGTTVDTQVRKKASINQGNEYLSSKDFVGGVSLGDYGAAAMELESYHNETDFGTSGPAPAHQSDLTAKKAYFMLDDGIVCLGTAVNAKNNKNAEVLTIVENRLCETSALASGENIRLSTPYEIVSAEANRTPESENTAENTIDESYSTKYAGDTGAELVWDLGDSKTLGFIDLSFTKGSARKQLFRLAVSNDNVNWTEVFSGESSGQKETNEYFDLKGISARYVKFINLGNSAGSSWVSLTNCDIYPPNTDGTVGLPDLDIYGSDKIVADGNEIKIYGDDKDLNGINWMNVGDNCGYVFPKSAAENIGSLKARWTKGASSYFELWFSHGVNPTNGGYAYMLLPGKTSAETKAYAEQNSVEILANNNDVQAVYDKKLGITGIVFWKAGTFGDITVDKPCIVMYRGSEESFEIAVSDPTQKLKAINVTVNKKLLPVKLDECISYKELNKAANLVFNMENSAGRSMAASFSTSSLSEEVTVFSCNDGAAAGIEMGSGELVDESIEGAKVYTPGGRSVKWTGGDFVLSLAGKGISQIPLKKNSV